MAIAEVREIESSSEYSLTEVTKIGSNDWLLTSCKLGKMLISRIDHNK